MPTQLLEMLLGFSLESRSVVSGIKESRSLRALKNIFSGKRNVVHPGVNISGGDSMSPLLCNAEVPGSKSSSGDECGKELGLPSHCRGVIERGSLSGALVRSASNIEEHCVTDSYLVQRSVGFLIHPDFLSDWAFASELFHRLLAGSGTRVLSCCCSVSMCFLSCFPSAQMPRWRLSKCLKAQMLEDASVAHLTCFFGCWLPASW